MTNWQQLEDGSYVSEPVEGARMSVTPRPGHRADKDTTRWVWVVMRDHDTLGTGEAATWKSAMEAAEAVPRG